MCEERKFHRREVMKMLAAVGFGGVAGTAGAAPIGAMMPGKGWMAADGKGCPGDGTPLQFIPKGAPDDAPLDDELAKYPKCPYCGMDRTKWHHSRHLVHYDDGLVDATCSIHCLAISLSLNLDRGPRAIYGADFGAESAIKPLIEVDQATYLIGSRLKPTMSRTSKMAFASVEAAEAVRTVQGGTLGSFDEALRESYLGMAEDTAAIRGRRRERRMRMMKKAKG